MKPAKRTYSIVSEDTWALIRSAYLSGLSGAVVAHRFNVSLSALRKRAQREGWTKTHQAQALGRAPATLQPAPPPSRDPRVLVRTAMDEAARALADGRPYAARACAAAGHQIARLADLLPDYIEADSVHEINARHAYWMSAVEEMALDLAQKLNRGERLPAEFDALDARWRAGQAGA